MRWFCVLMSVLCCAGCGMLCWADGADGVSRADEGRLVRGESLMEIGRDAGCGQVVVRCLVGDRPARMILDTGATHTVVSRGFAERELAGVPRLDTSQMEVVGNAQVVPDLVMTDVAAGGTLFRNMVVLVMDLEGVNAMQAQPVDGILGMDALRFLSFVLDFRRESFSWGCLRDTSALEVLEGARDEAGRLFVRVGCGGQVLRLLLDTGCSRTVVSPRVWPAGQAEGARAVFADVNGRREVDMPVGREAVLEWSPAVRSATVSPWLSPEHEGDGLVGLDALRGLILMHQAGKPGQDRFYVGPAR